MRCMYVSRPLKTCNFFSCYLPIRSFCYIISVPIFYSKLLCFLWLQWFICLCTFSINLFVEFSLVILMSPVLFLLLSPFSVSFNISFFVNIFWVIFPRCKVRLVCSFVLVFSSQHILVCFSFLDSFVSCRNFFIYLFSVISHPGFVYLFGFFFFGNTDYIVN